MNSVIVITEYDELHDEAVVVGVASSEESAEDALKEYYGEYKLLNTIHRPEACYFREMVIELNDNPARGAYKISVFLEWYKVY